MNSLLKLAAKAAILPGAGYLALFIQAAPASALNIFTNFDPNGDPSVNLLTTTGIPNSTAAESAFIANLMGVGTETFEAIAPGTLQPLSIVFPGAGTATLSGGSGVVSSTTAGTTNGFGRYGVSPTNYWEVVAGSAGDFSIDFSDPVAAFGFYGIDIGDFAGTLSLVFDNGTISTQAIPTAPQNLADGSVLYWGIITDPSEGEFSRIIFQTTTGSGDVFAFDNFTIGSREQVVPNTVPGPLPMLGVGAAFGWSRRIRRRINSTVA